jgi:hypothetical protein
MMKNSAVVVRAYLGLYITGIVLAVISYVTRYHDASMALFALSLLFSLLFLRKKS